MKDAMHFFATGGTIDAEAYPVDAQTGCVIPPEYATPRACSHVPHVVAPLLARHLPDASWTFQQLDMRDSKLYDEADMETIARAIRSRENTDVFVITHGTDRMMQNARYMNQFARRMGLENKTILFIGAMVPLANGEISDGYANLQAIVEHARDGTIPPGVHVYHGAQLQDGKLIHGEFLNPQEYEKDVKNSRFAKCQTPHALMTPYTESITLAIGRGIRYSPGHNEIS